MIKNHQVVLSDEPRPYHGWFFESLPLFPHSHRPSKAPIAIGKQSSHPQLTARSNQLEGSFCVTVFQIYLGPRRFSATRLMDIPTVFSRTKGIIPPHHLVHRRSSWSSWEYYPRKFELIVLYYYIVGDVNMMDILRLTKNWNQKKTPAIPWSTMYASIGLAYQINYDPKPHDLKPHWHAHSPISISNVIDRYIYII